MSERDNFRKTVVDRNRRRFVIAGGAAGIGTLAGCLGDDEAPDDVDDTDDAAPADDADDTDDTDDVEPADDAGDTDDADDTDDTTEAIERYDVAPVFHRGPELPGDATYARPWNFDALPDWVASGHGHYNLMERSIHDQRYASNVIDSWDYQPGILEFTLRDDIYWWSGDVMDAADYVNDQELRDFTGGGEDLDANPNIIAREVVDDFTVRISLADTWHENWALGQTIQGDDIHSSSAFLVPWLEEFEDTGGDMDAIGDVRDEIADVRADTDDEIVHQFHIPFEFRLNGDIGDVGEHHWEFELVPEKNGQPRAYADEINFERWRITAHEEYDPHQVESFMNEDMPFAAWDRWDDDIEFDFPTDLFSYRDGHQEWGWNFNCEIHPASDPYFRRAFVYATDRTTYERPPRRELTTLNGHPFLDDDRLAMWVSDEMIGQLTDYGTEAEWDLAEEELLEGGFERNDDGEWLYQEDSPDGDAGTPMQLEIGGRGWMDYVGDLGSDWFADLEDFGIAAESLIEIQDPWVMNASYVGGITPELIYSSIFGEDSLAFAINNNLGESVEAPPIGEPDTPQDEWVEYDTRTITDRLGVTVDEENYQDMVDQLTWVANQLVPRAGVVATTQAFHINDNRWHVTRPEDAPERWTRRPERALFYFGLLQYVPEEDR